MKTSFVKDLATGKIGKVLRVKRWNRNTVVYYILYGEKKRLQTRDEFVVLKTEKEKEDKKGLFSFLFA